jgi:DNA-binding transcriptional MerR regulator
MSAEARTLRIGDVATRVGVTPRTIRYYEERGLLGSADRPKGAHRLYGEADVVRLQELIRLRDLLGLSLEELVELAEAEEARAVLRDRWQSDPSDDERRAGRSSTSSRPSSRRSWTRCGRAAPSSRDRSRPFRVVPRRVENRRGRDAAGGAGRSAGCWRLRPLRRRVSMLFLHAFGDPAAGVASSSRPDCLGSIVPNRASLQTTRQGDLRAAPWKSAVTTIAPRWPRKSPLAAPMPTSE